MSLYGYTTKRDLSGFGNMLFMALIGIVLASLVNFRLKKRSKRWGSHLHRRDCLCRIDGV